MAQAPLTFLEKKWATNQGSNLLIRGATQDNQRTQIAQLDNDTHRNVSNFGRRTLMSIGRYIYQNVHPVRNAVLEIARQAVSTYIPQFYGSNSAFGEVAEAWLEEGDKFIDRKGLPYNMGTFRRNFVTSIYRDGDVGIVLATDGDQPRLQMIPSHRIGSRSHQTIVQGGIYDGARLIDGVIVDDCGAAIAYRVFGENTWDASNFKDISSNDMLLCYLPDYCDQCRGFSLLGGIVFEALDVSDSRNFELISQKIRASFAVQVKNESGLADKSKTLLGLPGTAPTSASGAANALPQQMIQPGQINYFQAGKGQGLEVLDYDRPGANVMAFQEEQIRSYLAGMGWSYDYSHNPTKAGGAQMRIVVEKINSVISELKSLVIQPTWARITGWRVAKGSKLKLIPEDVEWYKWRFQGPAEITADAKYTSDVNIKEIQAGIKAPQDAIEQGGGYWEDTQDKCIAWRVRLEDKCKVAGVDPDTIIWPTPNGVPPEQPEPSDS